ncbi:MAG: hypothetical protein K9L30_12965 [Desulfobacterales bacterium]|nr:hypothetical protein [Desulfobacterales bacterium]
MKKFDQTIKNNDFKAAEKSFLKDAEKLLKQGELGIIRQSLESLSDKIRQNSSELSFYYNISIHLIYPHKVRNTLFELIGYFTQKKEFNRVASIYSTLLINFMYYEETKNRLLTLVEQARMFTEDTKVKLSAYNRKILESRIQLAKGWVFLEYDRVFENMMLAEENALKLKDDAALFFSRLSLVRLYTERGRFSKALEQLEKTERLINKNERNSIFEPFLRAHKADVYLFMRMVPEAVEEVEKGLAALPEGSSFYYHIIGIQFYCYMNQENLKKCDQLVEQIVDEYPDPDADFRIYFLYFGQMLLAYLHKDQEKCEYFCRRLDQKENRKYFLYDYTLSHLEFAEINMFAGNFQTTFSTLDQLINELNVNVFPLSVATAYALMGILHHRKKDEKTAAGYFSLMEKVLIENEVEGLEIANNEVLKEIVDLSNCKKLRYLLKHRLEGMNLPDLSTEVYRTPKSSVEIQAFGDFKIFVDGKQIPVSVFDRQKKLAQILKQLIIYRDQGLPKEIIMDTYWEGYNLKSAQDNLNSLLYRLRKLFGAGHIFFSSESDNIRLLKEKCWIDIDDFEKYYRQGKKFFQKGDYPEALKNFEPAIALYKDDFMINDLYDDMIINTREALKKKLIQMLFQSTRLLLDDGDYQKAHHFSQKLISYDSYCEPAYRLLMTAAAISGNRSELPRIYTKLRDHLQQGLGVEPETRTQVLMEKLIQGVIPSSQLWEKETLL